MSWREVSLPIPIHALEVVFNKIYLNARKNPACLKPMRGPFGIIPILLHNAMSASITPRRNLPITSWDMPMSIESIIPNTQLIIPNIPTSLVVYSVFCWIPTYVNEPFMMHSMLPRDPRWEPTLLWLARIHSWRTIMSWTLPCHTMFNPTYYAYLWDWRILKNYVTSFRRHWQRVDCILKLRVAEVLVPFVHTVQQQQQDWWQKEGVHPSCAAIGVAFVLHSRFSREDVALRCKHDRYNLVNTIVNANLIWLTNV
mmetsp:Transcript_28111/g.50886  ORF Transcript_28111/g.50886 Transcript_28111/m.50886 type:complete len:255 (-) Transcript_28111:492-1256(-)